MSRTRSSVMVDEVDIAIVGAGAAGLAAAMRLRHSRLGVVVLEARTGSAVGPTPL
ncbi:MAG: NAD(P)-binding protein [Caulobacteraceae bacterium]